MSSSARIQQMIQDSIFKPIGRLTISDKPNADARLIEQSDMTKVSKSPII